MSIVHIHARDIARYDAVGNFARQVADLCAAGGWETRLWADHSDVDPDDVVGRRSEFWGAVKPADVVFFNFSIFDPDLPRLAALPNPKVLYFHNITPPDLVDRADRRTIENCAMGLGQRHLAHSFDILMANSAVSAEVLHAGMDSSPAIVICPPIVGADRLAKVTAEQSPGKDDLRLLYVGRLVANKNVLGLLDVFEELARLRPDAALDIVGGPADGNYPAELRERARAIASALGATVEFHHAVSPGRLKALYERAVACVTMTRHEGYCVPAVDSLAFDKPMFSAPVPAVLEVMGSAVVALPVDAPRDAAAIVAKTLADSDSLRLLSFFAKERFKQILAMSDGQIILRALDQAIHQRCA